MKRFFTVTGVLLGTGGVLLLALFFGYLGITAGVRLDPEKLALSTECAVLYDANGGEIGRAGRETVPYEDFPEHLKNAFVAVEDKRFFSHHGFDGRRIVKAALTNLKTHSFREGASTISQQLIKNTHLTGEKTIARKLKEFKLTRALEKRYSKEEILELYLNSIYFGHNAFGIGQAARFYFGKEVSALSAADCAMLAALVKSPNRYSPFKNAEGCRTRRDLVLTLMNGQGLIGREELESAKREPLPAAPAQDRTEDSYLSLVFEELSELFPELGPAAYGTLKVYTFLDPALQETLNGFQPQSDLCVCVEDNQTHGIAALRCSLPCLPKRLPASTIKPLLVYAPAIEEDLISPATPVLDETCDFGGYSPSDYGGKCEGYMSARYALAHSVNIPAVKILNEMGVDRAAGYLERLGLPVPEEDRSLALALGGMREGYRLTDLVGGYCALANGGAYAPSSAIARVEDGKGALLYSFSPRPVRVFSEETSCLVTDMLCSAAQEGTAKRLRFLGYPVAAKTGTGGTAAGNTDAYTIAYTSAYTLGVWLGDRDYSPVSATGGGEPANIALEVLRALGPCPAPFPACEGVERVRLDKREYESNHRLLLADPSAPPATSFSELFKRSALPAEASERFSRPKIEKPKISVINGTVCIELCQTEYYDYAIKREGDGKTVTVYSGKYREKIFDNSVRAGVEYRYTVIPRYLTHEGEAVSLPAVKIPETLALPDDWWKD